MSTEVSPELLAQMRRDWDDRARENLRHYVATGKKEWTDEEFFRSGEANVRQQILNDMINICQGKDPSEMRVLEIGCGAGRLTRALAKVFGRVDGVDVSGEMIERARRSLRGEGAIACLGDLWRRTLRQAGQVIRGEVAPAAFGRDLIETLVCLPGDLRDFPNARVWQNNGADLAMFGDSQFDFAFSYIVFQHIPSRAVIENYVREVGRVLKPGALFKFQVQGVPGDERWCDTWEGVGFAEQDMREMAARSGFEMPYCHDADTQYFWLWFFKGERPRHLP